MTDEGMLLMDRSRLAVLTLRVDAVANLALAAALAVGAAPLARTLGVTQVWPLLIVAGVLVVNGALCWTGAGAPRAGRLRALAAVDIVFAVAMLTLAAVDPWGGEAGVRLVLAGLGDVVGLVAVVKLWCAREREVGESIHAG